MNKRNNSNRKKRDTSNGKKIDTSNGKNIDTSIGKAKNIQSGWLMRSKTIKFEYLKKAMQLVWSRIRESLIWSVVKAILLIFVLIFMVFKIKPSQAHVSAILSELDNIIKLDAAEITLHYPDLHRLRIYSTERVSIDLDQYKVVEFPEYDFSTLFIYPREDNDNFFKEQSEFSICDNTHNVYLYDVSYNSDYFYFDNFSCIFDDSLKLEINDGIVIFITSNGEKVEEPNIKSLTIVEENPPSQKSPLFYSFFKFESTGYNPFFIETPHSSGKIHARKISYLKAVMTGNLTFSYAQTPQEYNLYRQELVLENENYIEADLINYDYLGTDDLELDCKLVYPSEDDAHEFETEGSLYGFITNGEVSKMSLFPSFKTWFYSNAYMTPTAIIAVVLTAVGLFNKKGGK